MPTHLALPSFARQIVSSEQNPIVRVGNLTAERDFLDVKEVARLLLSLAALPRCPWPLVNLCSGRGYRLSDLLDDLIAASGVPVRILAEPSLMRPNDMALLVGSTKRLASIGLTPEAPDFAILLPQLLAEAQNGMRTPEVR